MRSRTRTIKIGVIKAKLKFLFFLNTTAKHQQTQWIPFNDSFDERVELPEWFPQNVICTACAACVALFAWTLADMFSRWQSSRIPACMRNYTSEKARLRALFVSGICIPSPFHCMLFWWKRQHLWPFSIGKYEHLNRRAENIDKKNLALHRSPLSRWKPMNRYPRKKS